MTTYIYNVLKIIPIYMSNFEELQVQDLADVFFVLWLKMTFGCTLNGVKVERT